MSFMSYMWSLWGPSPASADYTPRGGSGASAQQLGSGLWPLSAQVREEMKRGTRYNMKVVLRGTRATGKSTLLARLSGHPLPVRYTPSTELIASTMRLQGELCAPHEGTKVDIWEVVEEGRQRSASSLSENPGTEVAAHVSTVQLHEILRLATDARLLDIYSRCQLVIFMIDPRQRSSWEYAKQETLHIPPTCCILYALNFSDVGPLTATSDTVALDEVESWCNRVRRATTGFIHRVLEGRQAPAEFSVRAMTAVLSAQTGAGMLGVLRALHVASTLVRITAEEVRVQELLALLARQQAVSIADCQSLPTPPVGPASVEGTHADQSPASGTAPSVEALRTEPHTQASSLPPFSNTSAGYALNTAAPSSMRDAAQAPHHSFLATPEAKTCTTPASQPDSGGLIVQHRSSTVVATLHNKTGGAQGDGKVTNPYQTSGTRPISDSEAMRLFLGASDSVASGRSSPHSSSSSVSGTTSGGGWVGTTYCPTAHLPVVPSAAPSIANLAHEGLAQNSSAAACANTGVSGLTPPPLSTEPPSPLPTPQVVRPPAEELVVSLATNMVHDVSVPVDNFFAEEREKGELTDEASEGDPATPISPAPQSVSPVLRTARTLTTQRVVRRESMHISGQTAAPDPVFHVDVSTILAQMTAALTADVSIPTAGGDSHDAVLQHATQLDSAQQEVLSVKSAKKLPYSAPDSSAARGRHHHHHHHHRKKHRDAANRNATTAVTETPEKVDNGSFDLVLV
ncbi:conserved hypothetical protein [Leishmania braziliensis MHOM/BR/75/M2904]|uniref:Uncharacterized protein n=1 Tax=Leishmania braziliensis TaxID=5660 RepID=A4HQE4_LEIBR|nr:conserved hypothetical protein [Leishmania braziliensis MHOM/BR/75/M2904]CAJ2482246.1 unnamed protein product [Leishmania braziliensis]CAM44409.1 conserved hypothetical protein [Leishmania braziliensis MHOM/BR/75/M2904]